MQSLVGAKGGELDSYALPGIQTQDLWFSSRLPEPLHRRSALVENEMIVKKIPDSLHNGLNKPTKFLELIV